NPIHAGFTSVECECAVLAEKISFVDLIVMELSTELQRVRAPNLREIVLNLIGVVELTGSYGRNSNYRPNGSKIDRRHAIQRWFHWGNSAVEHSSNSGWSYETQ